ncbi:4-hydroxythreonine-4-phosphate dehydrogenase PdxA [bacterium]|nr:4-hydroxythreonine-4-phosphate dehydrogenase PdxA [bacterium]
MGDPAGIGPEVIVKGWLRGHLHAICRPFAVGSTYRMIDAVRRFAPEGRIHVHTIAGPEAVSVNAANDIMPVIEPSDAPDVSGIAEGIVDARCGLASYRYLDAAIDLALAKRIDAIVTLGLHKEALNLAGVAEPGHTEILARRCGVADSAMMLYLPPEPGRHSGIGVVHATLHVALRKVFDLLTPERLDAAIALAEDAIGPFLPDQSSRPRIAVVALNPHAGEGGLFGDEETRLIAPAVARARARGCDVAGPISADTLFGRAMAGEFDAVVAMYHDQGHIALKTLGFDRAVNVTCGLPIVRTSVAHGTAFDIVGKGQARADSLESATYAAAKIAAWRGARSKRTSGEVS